MQGHPTSQQLDRYEEGICSAREVSMIESHLNSCSECRNRVRKQESTDRNIQTLLNEFRVAALDNPTYHFDYDQVVAYVEDRLDFEDKENADSHLEICSLCSAQVQDLKAFKIQLSTHINNRQSASPVIYAQPNTEEHSTHSGWRNSLTGLSFLSYLPSTPFGLRPSALIAVVAIFLFILSLYLLIPQTGRGRNDQVTSVVTTPHTNTIGNVAGNQSLQNAAESPGVKKQVTAPTADPDETTGRSRQGRNSDEVERFVKDNSPARSKRDMSRPSRAPLTNDKTAAIGLKDGGSFISINQEGKISGINLNSARLKKEVANALLNQNLPVSKEVNDLTGTAGVLLSGHTTDSSFQVLGPVGIIVMSDRPVFNWSPVKGASGYQVTIIDSHFNVISSEIIKTNHWTAKDPLLRGETYRWQVTAFLGDKSIKSPKPPAPEAKFKVMEKNRFVEVKRLILSSQKSHLVQAVIYAENGMLDEAEKELQILNQENPGTTLIDDLIKNLKPKAAGASSHASP